MPQQPYVKTALHVSHTLDIHRNIWRKKCGWQVSGTPTRRWKRL